MKKLKTSLARKFLKRAHDLITACQKGGHVEQKEACEAAFGIDMAWKDSFWRAFLEGVRRAYSSKHDVGALCAVFVEFGVRTIEFINMDTELLGSLKQESRFVADVFCTNQGDRIPQSDHYL